MSAFYCYDYPQKEKSVELAIEVIKIALQFQHMPVIMDYSNQAAQVLQEWGVDVVFRNGDEISQ